MLLVYFYLENLSIYYYRCFHLFFHLYYLCNCFLLFVVMEIKEKKKERRFYFNVVRFIVVVFVLKEIK